jgi:hypothetical protein
MTASWTAIRRRPGASWAGDHARSCGSRSWWERRADPASADPIHPRARVDHGPVTLGRADARVPVG